MTRIAVLTSGGDAPGMNAAVRAVVRTAVDRGWEVFGVKHGFNGLIADDFIPLGARSVGGIIGAAGTILGSARSAAFETVEGEHKAVVNLQLHQIDGVVVIGGNGSQAGAHALYRRGVGVVGIASTIDNDLYGADITIGVDTALNVALEAIDRLRATGSSLDRAFLVEVMGRNCGYLALAAALAGGAETVSTPEIEVHPEVVLASLRDAHCRGKSHAIAVVSEGARFDAEAIARYARERREEIGFELRTTTLGHVQRGATPTAFDRLLATRLGARAVEQLAKGEKGVLVGLAGSQIHATRLEEVVTRKKELDQQLYDLAVVLAK